ncbi:hypothetical protein DKX38_008530 [Salix brachista]|uniref:Uncharacterized protein n=1 Tax=Salix brachista TaxID=2182728 RepID=A0A5N5MTB7_9ROSI|nr:hypothetical protein DKX38_008530 [Salix brachista]
MVEWSSRSFDESVLMNFFQQVAAFRATLEMPEPLLLVNVVGIRIDEVDKVLSELDVSSIPRLMVWNKDSMVWVEALVPFDKEKPLSIIHQVGVVERTEYTESGTLIKPHVSLCFARLLTPMRQLCDS